MPADALLVLATSATVATTTNGSAVILPGGTPRRGLWAHIIYSASTSTTTNAATFSLDVCYDGVPTTWRADFLADPPLALTTTAQGGEIYIPFNVSPTVISGVIVAPQIRLTVTVSGAGTASITYKGDVVTVKP